MMIFILCVVVEKFQVSGNNSLCRRESSESGKIRIRKFSVDILIVDFFVVYGEHLLLECSYTNIVIDLSDFGH